MMLKDYLWFAFATFALAVMLDAWNIYMDKAESPQCQESHCICAGPGGRS